MPIMACVICRVDTSVVTGLLPTCLECCGVLDAMPLGVQEQLYRRLRLGHPPAHVRIDLTHRVVLDAAGGTILAYTTGEGEAQAVQLALLQAMTCENKGSHLEDDPGKAAQELGLVIVLPGPRDLFVDIDNEADYLWLLAMVEVMGGVGVQLEVDHVSPSKSGLPRRHVYLRADRDLTPVERIALQAALGSDRKRELLSLLRVWLHTDRPPTLFFEQPGHPRDGGQAAPDWEGL